MLIEQLQQRAYGDYPDRRATAVDAAWRAMNRRARREATPEQLIARYDEEHLLICAGCEIAFPTSSASEAFVHRCPYCKGDLLDWTDRATVVPLSRRLDAIAERLHRR